MEIHERELDLDHLDTLISMANLVSTISSRPVESTGRAGRAGDGDSQKETVGRPCSTLMGIDEEVIRLMEECVSSRRRVLGAHHHLTVSSAEALL
jgi:hypothetical protein